jgi:hypothetical protein
MKTWTKQFIRAKGVSWPAAIKGDFDVIKVTF